MYIEDEWGKLKTVIIGRSEEYLNSAKSEKQNSGNNGREKYKSYKNQSI
mgnify:FL=1